MIKEVICDKCDAPTDRTNAQTLMVLENGKRVPKDICNNCFINLQTINDQICTDFFKK